MNRPGHESSTAEEKLLVQSVEKGDADAFKLVVKKYEKLVFSIVYKMVADAGDREDICQDVFVKVYEKMALFRFESRLSTWIGSIAFRHCLDHIKRKKPLLVEDPADGIRNDVNERQGIHIAPDESGARPDELLMSKERVVMLYRAINELSPVQKTVLNLFYQQEFSLEETARVTGLPVNTIKSHLFRARKELKDHIIKQMSHGT